MRPLTITAISFFFLLFLAFPVSALEIEVESPSNVSINEEFNVIINSEEQESYDVKIFIHTAAEGEKITRGKIVSSIYGSEWQSSWNYILASYPEKKNYLVKAHQAGSWQICVQFRRPEANTYIVKECKPIFVSDSEPVMPIPDSEENSSNNSINNEEDENSASPQAEKEDLSSISSHLSSEELKNDSSSETLKIELNKPPSSSSKKIVSKEKYIQMGMSFAFTVLCIVIIFMIVKRKL